MNLISASPRLSSPPVASLSGHAASAPRTIQHGPQRQIQPAGLIGGHVTLGSPLQLRRRHAAPLASPRDRPSFQIITRASPSSSSSSSSSSLSSSLKRDVRAVPIKIITVSKGNSQGAVAMSNEWLEKLQRYTSVIQVQVKPNPKRTANNDLQREAEGEKVVKAMDSRDWVVLLCERGRPVCSEDFAALIGKAGDEGRPLTFAIGGPFGHGSMVEARSDESVRLSNCVLNHSVAHVVLLEQLYRGWTILRGEPYHH